MVHGVRGGGLEGALARGIQAGGLGHGSDLFFHVRHEQFSRGFGDDLDGLVELRLGFGGDGRGLVRAGYAGRQIQLELGPDEGDDLRLGGVAAGGDDLEAYGGAGLAADHINDLVEAHAGAIDEGGVALGYAGDAVVGLEMGVVLGGAAGDDFGDARVGAV